MVHFCDMLIREMYQFYMEISIQKEERAVVSRHGEMRGRSQTAGKVVYKMKKYKEMSVEEIVNAQKRSGILRGVGYGVAAVMVVYALLGFLYQTLSLFNMLMLLVTGFLVYRLVSRLSKLRYGKTELILLDDCDPDKYIRVYEMIREKKPEKSQLDTVSIAKGYFFKGDFERARQELAKVDRERMKGASWVAYYNVAVQNYLELGEMQHAAEVRQEIEKYAASQKAGSPASGLAKQLEKYADFAIAFRKRDFETARRVEDEIYGRSAHAAQLSFLYYRMAVMELDAGQTEDAREHLEYVKEYGGQIFVRKQAMELLEKMEQ